jgi:hypothetical protein
VYEVDGGEWLDFVSADLKHLTPRPERPERQRPAEAVGEDAPEAEVAEAEIITHPALVEAAEPPLALVPADEPATAPQPEPAPEPVAALAEAPAYEPDQERRDKFFSRLSRWAKK